jgi:SAM-dependent methyltransferase
LGTTRLVVRGELMNSDLFAGTAEYYARYRPAYPASMLDDIRARTVGEGGNRLVDLGCGTGEVTLPLRPYFTEVLATDIDPDMVSLAERKAAAAGVVGVRWRVGRAEELTFPPASCDLVTAGSSFHWMDRELMSARIFDGLVPGGALVLLGGGPAVWSGRSEWHDVAAAVLTDRLGTRRRAGSGVYSVDKVHEDFLGPAGFRIETTKYTLSYTWTTGTIVGYLLSTSFAGPRVLGDRREAVERDLRERLLRLRPDGIFPEDISFSAIVGFRDR